MRDSSLMAVEIEPKLKGRMSIRYAWSLGPHGAKFFEALRSEKRIFGIRCSSCKGVLVPPLPVCGRCFKPMDEWVELPPTGVARGIVPYLLEVPDQRLKPPVIFAKIHLDGASSSFTHILRGVESKNPPPSVRVRAVWREERVGSLEDMDFFEPAR